MFNFTLCYWCVGKYGLLRCLQGWMGMGVDMTPVQLSSPRPKANHFPVSPNPTPCFKCFPTPHIEFVFLYASLVLK